MKVIEQYFVVLLFVMLCKLVLTFNSEDEFLKSDYSVKVIEKGFAVAQLIMSYKVYSMGANIKCDHSGGGSRNFDWRSPKYTFYTVDTSESSSYKDI